MLLPSSITYADEPRRILFPTCNAAIVQDSKPSSIPFPDSI